MARLDHSVTSEYFELDFGGRRFTHYPSGDTCLREDWMVGLRDGRKWTEKLTAFLADHPEASIIVNSRYEIIDDANSLPHRGGEYEVGDVVMMHVWTPSEEWGWCARTVAERHEFLGDGISEPSPYYTLDDGSQLYWSDRNNGWTASIETPKLHDLRVRRPLDGEEILTLEQKMEGSQRFSV